MQQMTMQDIRSLLAETGHVLTVQDIEPIVALDEAADIIVNGPVDKSDSIYAYPIICGGEAFVAPTIGKQLYWEEQVSQNVPEDMWTCAYLWLLTFADVPEERGADILKAVKRWGRKCKLTADQVVTILNAYNKGDGGNDKANYGEIIALLVREYGQDCEHWLNAPEAEIAMLIADWTRTQEAKAAAYRKSKAGSKNPLPPVPSPKIKALKTYRELKDRLRESWLKSE